MSGKFWSKFDLDDVAGQLQHITKRVYLLECECGTQEGRDIRVFEKRPGQEHTIREQPITVVSEFRKMQEDLARSRATQRNQYDTIRRLQSEVKSRDKTLDSLREAARRQVSSIESLQVKLERQGDIIGRYQKGQYVSRTDCPAMHYPYMPVAALYHQCPCGKGWVRG